MEETKKNYKGMLPLGSVVKLDRVEPYVMICGRIVCAQSDDHIYDYVGCLYPEGIGKNDELVFFDREAIEELFFIGYQDEYELMYRTEILDQLGELVVEDGELVEAETAPEV